MTEARSSRLREGRRLSRSFFDRPTKRVARELLGAVVVDVGDDGHERAVRLVETEAYVHGDPANHAYRGPTERNRSMFGRPGTLYVYRIHQVVCANLVTRPGEAVLLRAGAPLSPELGRPVGPGRLCRVLELTLADDGVDAVTGGRLRLLARPGGAVRVAVGPRVGIRRAADRPLRFAVVGSPWVSRPRPPAVGPLSEASPTRSRGVAASRRTRTTRRRSSGGGRSGGRSAGR